MSARKPPRLDLAILRLWHAVMAGGFLVAYLTGDEDTYAMHVFSGYAVLAAAAIRLVLGLLAPGGSPLRLPRPSMARTLEWMGNRRGRNPLYAWLGAAVLASVGLAAATGAVADVVVWLEDPHEALSEASLMAVFVHVGFILFVHGGKRLLARLATASAVVVALAAGQAQAADPRAAVLDHFATRARAADPAFAGFSAERGEALFRTKWAGGDERTPSCTACHTENPRRQGRNAKTGRPIEPVAVSANPKRFTDLDEVEKQFGRDCKSVLGRECTAREKGDYITFMKGQ
ncbi:MAG: DUF1924 domain-containing protein [Pseudomonadota bacterium]